MDDVVYQEKDIVSNHFRPYIYSWKILKMIDFMDLQGEGTYQFVILPGGGTCG